MDDSLLDVMTQYGALPLRWSAGRLELLLVTSRESRRWVLPKGWPMKGLTPAETAAREALEEAGVEGKIAVSPIGFYHYDKRLKSGIRQLCRVEVYPLEVKRVRASWPEAGQRGRRWFDPAGAALAVEEAELADLIRHMR